MKHQSTRLRTGRPAIILLPALLLASIPLQLLAQPAASAPKAQKVIIDTDIGDDIDDVLAVGLALRSPELQVLGFTTAWGFTTLRARLLDRLLEQVGHSELRVAVGIEKHHAGEGAFSQAVWAQRQVPRPHPDAVTFLLDQIRRNPGEITLIGIAPLTNLAAALERDPATFRKLQRIVIMGASIERGYDDLGYAPSHGPSAEYNIAMDPAAAQKVFASGIPLFVMPLDSTQIKFDVVQRQIVFTASTPLTDALTLLYQQWARTTKQETPTMFDAVAVAYAVDPAQCPVTPMHLTIDAQGYTRRTTGEPNSSVCLRSDTDKFFAFYMPRMLEETAEPALPLQRP